MKKDKIGFWSVVSIGVGGMIGGGIFAVLGLAVQLAKGGTPVAFVLAGIIALITSYICKVVHNLPMPRRNC